jgi:nucleoid DNA-binding protein
MANNLTKRDIILEVCSKKAIQQNEAKVLVQIVLDIIAKALAEGRNVELRNFGVFELQVRQRRVGRNPNKPEKDLEIPERVVVKFKTGKELKVALEKLDMNQLKKTSFKSSV